MKIYLTSLFIFTLLTASCAQENNAFREDCEICNAVYESPVPFEQLSSADTLPDFGDPGPRLKIEGTIYHKDGRSPAPDVVLYIYHTDQNGIYPKKGNETGYARQHGYIRGWIKSDENGRYSFYTLRPASYPNSRAPAHIHAVVKEPEKDPYWIDDFLFEDDPFLASERSHLQNRGGSGVLKLQKTGHAYYSAKRDIILGKNVPGF